MLDVEEHTAGFGDYLLDLLQVDEEGAVATYYHRIGVEVVFELLGGGTEHVGTHFAVAKLIDFYVVADGFDV